MLKSRNQRRALVLLLALPIVASLLVALTSPASATGKGTVAVGGHVSYDEIWSLLHSPVSPPARLIPVGRYLRALDPLDMPGC